MQRRAPQGPLKESDDFSAILKAIVDLESSNKANSREAQQQSCSQALLDECDVAHQSPRRRASQSVHSIVLVLVLGLGAAAQLHMYSYLLLPHWNDRVLSFNRWRLTIGQLFPVKGSDERRQCAYKITS